MSHSMRLSLVCVQAILTFGLLGLPAQAQQTTLAAVAAQQAPPVKPPKPAALRRPPDPRRWDIEFHGNFGFGDTSAGGNGELPAAGVGFTTNGGSPTRQVPSWFFGDGAALFNDVLASFGRSERITPLDNVLTRQSADHAIDDGFGVRVTRALRPGIGIEMSVDVARASITLTSAARNGIEAASDSFAPAFGGLVATGQGVAFTNPSLSSSFAFANGSGLDVVSTGAFVFGPSPDRRFRPYVLAGAGLVTATGSATATLTGHYAFSLPSGGRIDETDEVRVRFAGGNGVAVVAGGGVNLRFSKGSGIRLDARVLYLENHIQTVVDTHPSAVRSMPADAIWSSLTPGIQFVTDPSTGLSGNLTAPGLSGFRSLHGSGFHTRFNVSVGYFFRF